MNLLAIETSSPVLSVAVKKSGAKLRHTTVQGHMKHAENLLPVIDRLLKKEKMKLQDIDAFLISRGPGSFTGLRIGFATLKGFLAVCHKPCYGASSLDIIAAGVKETGRFSKTDSSVLKRGPCPPHKISFPPHNLTVCLDARRGKLYARSYRYYKKRWIPCGPSRVALLNEKLSEKSLIAGDGTKKLCCRGFAVAPEKNWVPRAATLIRLFEAKDPLLVKLSRPKDLLPVYLRCSEAEERLSERKNHG